MQYKLLEAKGMYNIIRRAEELLRCRFYKSRTSPIGVGRLNTDPNRNQHYFNLLPEWFRADSSLISSGIPALLGSGHPILKLRQNIDLDAEEQTVTVLSNNIQWRALVIMLVSNAFGYSNVKSPELINLAEARQVTLSEIAEMMNFAFSVHRTLVEISRSKSNDVAMEEKESSLHLGNKMAVLFGDLLLARTSRGLSSLKNARVTELMSDAISDFSESEILRRKHLDLFNPVLNETSHVFSELTGYKDKPNKRIDVPSFNSWRKRVELDLGSLVGRSCLCSTLLSQHDEGASNLAFRIGRHVGLLMQAYYDLELYIRARTQSQPVFDLSGLPLMFQLNSDSVRFKNKPTNISEVYVNSMTNPMALTQTQGALKNLKEEVLLLIAQLPKSTPASQILDDFISTLP